MPVGSNDHVVFPVRLGADPAELLGASVKLQKLLEVNSEARAIALWAELVVPHRSQLVADLARDPEAVELPVRLSSSARLLIRFSGELEENLRLACVVALAADPVPSSHDPLRYASARFAHDLNNLLMSLQGNAELGLMQLDKQSAPATCFREIQAACHRTKESTDELLTYAGKGRFKLVQEDVRLFLEHFRKEFLAELPPGFGLKLLLPTSLPLVPFDRDLLLRAMKALVRNSLRAMGHKPGMIEIKAAIGPHDFPEGAVVRLRDHQRPTDDWLMITVSDSGSGIPEHLLSRVFDPYFTTWPRTKGLGLAFVEGAMAQHRGMVVLQTQPTGTAVTLLVPAWSTQFPARTEVVTSAAPPMRVLIIDEDLPVGNVARETLSRAGFKPQHVQTAEAAREALKGTVFVAVMMDLHLPDAIGLHLAMEIRHTYPDLPILFCSGFADASSHGQTHGMARTKTLAKPYRAKDLQDTMRGLVAAGAELRV